MAHKPRRKDVHSAAGTAFFSGVAFQLSSTVGSASRMHALRGNQSPGPSAPGASSLSLRVVAAGSRLEAKSRLSGPNRRLGAPDRCRSGRRFAAAAPPRPARGPRSHRDARAPDPFDAAVERVVRGVVFQHAKEAAAGLALMVVEDDVIPRLLLQLDRHLDLGLAQKLRFRARRHAFDGRRRRLAEDAHDPVRWWRFTERARRRRAPRLATAAPAARCGRLCTSGQLLLLDDRCQVVMRCTPRASQTLERARRAR